MTGRIFLKLIFAVVCFLIVALVAVDFLASKIAERTYQETLTTELAERARLVGMLLRSADRKVQELGKTLNVRITLVDADGRVLDESDTDAARMENHRNRPEIQEALNGRIGSSVRPSPTLGIPFLYVAIPDGGRVLRAAVPIATVRVNVNEIRRKMLAAVGIAFVPAFILAAFFARYVSRRLGSIIDYAGKLAEGQFTARLADAGPDELGILGRKLNETAEKLQRTVEQLRREHVELEKLERVRKDFVINVSHELRTPLASIQGYTETLLDGALEDQQNNVRFLGIIRQNAERLGRLTADLLTLSRIELKTQQFQFAGYYVNGLLRESVDSVRPIADKKQIRIELVAGPPQTEIFCDSEALHQVLSNLLDNAIKYTPEQGSITVGASVVSGGKFVEFYVRDTGIGIPDEDLPRLFERFYRVDKARSRELGGTGLGLAIVKHLVKAHGGEVSVTSKLSEGSTFSFTVPLEDASLPENGSVQGQLTAL